MATPQRPTILLLSLAFQGFFDDQYSNLINKLHASADIKRVKKPDPAMRYLETNTPTAIIITDQGLHESHHRHVLDRVVAYAHTGGVVIAGLHFTCFTDMDQFDAFFAAFDLPWKHGDYHRTDFAFNSEATLPAGAEKRKFPEQYSMKALHVKNARENEKIYKPVKGAQTQSHVFAAAPVDEKQAAATGAVVGSGYLVYCGDVNAEEGSDGVVLAVLGL